MKIEKICSFNMREINATLFFIKKFNLIILFAYIYEIFALWKF